jgi:hypothetical protein
MWVQNQFSDAYVEVVQVSTNIVVGTTAVVDSNTPAWGETVTTAATGYTETFTLSV